MQISDNKVVAIDYSLKDDSGQLLDSSEGNGPLYYLHGANNIISGLESALEGKSEGDSVQAVLAPADAYGERNEQLRQEVSRSHFAQVGDLAVGMQFNVPGGDAGDAVVTVVDFDDDTVTVDGNHPLAGQTLHFDVTVREVRDATQEELDHGHVHGPGGHAH